MQCDPSKDYFAILGLSSQAHPEVVKAAHRALAKKYHPDLHSGEDAGAEQRFQEIQEAYEVLRDEDKLKQYLDLRAQLQLQMQQQTAPAQPHIRPRVYLKLDDRWDHLVRQHPELSQRYAKFCFLSHKLGRQYKLIILGAPNPARFKRVGAKLERQFYRRHFSYHRNLQTLAKKLAANHRRHAVRMLQAEIKGRRFVTKRTRAEMVWRYESRYLQPAAPARAANRSSQRTRVQRGAAHRQYPGQQRMTLKSSHNP
ncbi:MAG: DnaJ domain-containing protein, partial [Pseudomonadota bacterium]